MRYAFMDYILIMETLAQKPKKWIYDLKVEVCVGSI